MVKYIFITLSRVNLKDMTVLGVYNALKRLEDRKMQLFAVQEFHKDGHTHIHALLVLGKGLSKHVYKKVILRMFPDFSGWGIDVRGVRNLKFTCKYIIKCVKSVNDITAFGGSVREFCKLGGLEELTLYISILKFEGTFEQWKEATLENRAIFYKRQKKVLSVWNDVQKDKILPWNKVLDCIHSNDFFTGLRTPGLKTAFHPTWLLALLKLAQILFTPHQWKQTNLVIIGGPNTGKTTLFKKFEEATKGKFHWCSTRPGDIRMYDTKKIGIILDDVFSKNEVWSIPLLLKMLGREGFTGDQKMANLVEVPRRVPVFIITNWTGLFANREALQARVLRCYVWGRVDWLGLKNPQFLELLDLLEDVVRNIEVIAPEAAKELRYLQTMHVSEQLGKIIEFTDDMFRGKRFALFTSNSMKDFLEGWWDQQMKKE